MRVDITCKKYNETREGDKRITYLNPAKTDQGYFIETGLTAINREEISLPDSDTIWKVKGNNKLSEGSSVTVEWSNKSGLVFKKKIELDSKFLFRITQEIQNKSSEAVELYPYAQITRNKKPTLKAGSMSGTLILHDGFIGVFDEDLKEYAYEDIKDKKKAVFRLLTKGILVRAGMNRMGFNMRFLISSNWYFIRSATT